MWLFCGGGGEWVVLMSGEKVFLEVALVGVFGGIDVSLAVGLSGFLEVPFHCCL
jgi:hypothetical protein